MLFIREGGDVQFETCSIGLAPDGGVGDVPGDSNAIPSRLHVPVPSDTYFCVN